jgi:hypothetical protein
MPSTILLFMILIKASRVTTFAMIRCLDIPQLSIIAGNAQALMPFISCRILFSSLHLLRCYPTKFGSWIADRVDLFSQIVAWRYIFQCLTYWIWIDNNWLQAVLLLRPNVPLYSTDALPANCSAYSSSSDESRPTPPPSQIEESFRTCECLTQTLCCHGCGNAVGYMIVIPVWSICIVFRLFIWFLLESVKCQRCTSSMSASNRSTNGHRFVFHSSEIYASERHYIYGEPGVISLYPQPPPSCPAHPQTIYPTLSSVSDPPVLVNNPDPAQIYYDDHLPTPPADSNYEERQFFFIPDVGNNASSPPGSPIANRSLSPSPPLPALLPVGAFTPPSQIHFSSPMPPPPITLAKLKPGEVLYWHHLTKNGEIPGVQLDDRARGRRYTQDGYKEFLSDNRKWTLEGGVTLRGMPVVCGR